ncbi:hypothetical protein KVR01_009174 [Diaporthe batatas]|uniref:uncharacterized protein n=1 Tax=Diaporthe batatas TaxID=748121 RepID=UPI001D0376B3|nr:uncharacterized protein KVR01_009174 [Diaporthe batatas]KAG8160910.1 hypothetical protein KVR01_009174 [Diaporthe batatas]
MAAMNAPEGEVKFVPKQALAPSPQLYDELVSDGMENLAKASLALIRIPDGAIINDNGCGTGAATAAVVDSLLPERSPTSVTIKGNDINEDALIIYRKRSEEGGWSAEGVNMDSNHLGFDTSTFDITVGNALLFVLPDSIAAIKEVYRTLKPGGVAVFNTWALVPTIPLLEVATKETRPEWSPLPRAGLEKWTKADFLSQVISEGGFKQIKVHQQEVYTTVTDIHHYANMLWSFIGGTTPIGWLQSDEENWDKAIEVIIRELRRTDGYREVEGGRSELKFIANIAVATK